MSDDNSNSFTFDLSEMMETPPPEIDVRATYGDISIDEFARQHVIGYLGLPLEWDEEDKAWSIEVTIAHIQLMERFVVDLQAMEFGEALEWGEHDGEDELPDGVLGKYGFREYRGE